jgi:hypothetical protein
MRSRIFFSAAALCAVMAASVSTPAHAQFGAVRRAAQRAVGGAVQGTPATQPSGMPAPASQASAASQVNRGVVLELTPEVLDRFGRALAAYETHLDSIARALAGLKGPEEYMQCQLDWFNSDAGQAMFAKLTAASESGDYARITAAGEENRASLARACGPDAQQRDEMEMEASNGAEAAALAAGGFEMREFAVIQERVVPFCRAAAQTGGGDVRIAGEGRNVFWVYTATEAAALNGRCAALLAGLEKIS